MEIDLFRILDECMQRKASDLHLTLNEPPILRINGELIRTEYPPLSRDELKRVIYGIMTDEHRMVFERDLELEFALSLPRLDRFRVNIHQQQNAIEAAFRRVPVIVPTLDELGLPAVVADLARRPNGLVLVTGPTGTGKTTTLAAMVELINSERKSLIICIEDPIEIQHVNKLSIVKQREVVTDTRSFPQALRHVLRQDPDVIVVGEMRDLETISTALTAAETGHLVLATLHTPDAPQTVSRIIDIFPPSQQEQIKLQLADALQGIVSQLLLPTTDEQGRVLATEILVATPAIRNLIREHQIEQIPSLMQINRKFGMHTMDSSLAALYAQGRIARDTALGKAKDPEHLLSLTTMTRADAAPNGTTWGN